MGALWGFLAFTALVVFTPGAATAVVARHALRHGPRAAMRAALAVAGGNASQGVVAGLGVAALLARIPGALRTVSVLGALYLAWLGLRQVIDTWRARRLPIGAGGPPDSVGPMREGFTTALLNPAVTTFYLTVVPTFLPGGAAAFGARGGWLFAGAIAVHVSMAFACHTMWAYGLERLQRVWSHASLRHVLELATGAALLFLAARVLSRTLGG